MNQETVEVLEAINRDFYRRHAREFSRTRAHPWPGWGRVVDSFRRHGGSFGSEHRETILGAPTPWDVLDAGCGNGRLVRLLASEVGARPRYLGIDLSLPLVAEARRPRLGAPGLEAAYLVGDLLETGRWPLTRRRPVARTVVAFGVLHHVAAFERRRALLSHLGKCLTPDGLLAVSFWQFGDRDRFRRRRVAWDTYNRRAERPVDIADLEAGDCLLAWGEKSDDGSRVRYCHHAGASEAAALVSAAGLEVLETFESDGRGGDLNLYYVLKRSSSSRADRGSSRCASG